MKIKMLIMKYIVLMDIGQGLLGLLKLININKCLFYLNEMTSVQNLWFE